MNKRHDENNNNNSNLVDQSQIVSEKRLLNNEE